MKINPIKKRLFIDSLLLAITLLLVLVTGKDGSNNEKEPKISPRYLLNGTRVEEDENSIFDFYDISNNEYAVSLKDSVKTTQGGTITIPAMHDGKKVTGIWHNAFHNSPATGITFESPNNITVIDFEAFFYSKITSIRIPYSVSAIGDAAFYSCNNLTTVAFINSSQTSSGGGACSCDTPTEEEEEEDISYCTLTKIPSYCFFKCESLKTVTFPTSVQEIGEEAFNGCRSIDSPLFFQRIKIIRSRAFQGCTSLTSVYIPKTLFEDANGAGIEPHAFNFCDTSLEFVFCGTDQKIDAWLANHPNWGWRVNSNPSGALAKYEITRRETGDSYFTSDWSYSVDGDGNVTLKSYNGPTPTSATGYLISIPDTMPGEPAGNKVRRIDVGVFNPTVKAALRRLYLPTTLWVIENKMFADGYTELFIIDDNTACTTDSGYTNNDYPGRIDLSGLTELEFIGVHSFAKKGKGLNRKSRIKSLHLPANLRSIGDEAFGVFSQRMLPNVTEFIWDFDESTSRLETIGADCFYGVGIGGSGQITGNVDWKAHTSTTIVFPKTFKYFGILTADENRYRNQETNPFNFQLYNGEAEKGEKWERPAHAFIGCSLISTVIFKGDATDASKTTDLLIPLQTFVYNESLHTIIFEERKGHYITFHTQQQSGDKWDFSQECIGGNAGRGSNDFRGEPFLQTIILPNQQTKLRFQKFAFKGNSRAAMYFSGPENQNIFFDKKDGIWKNLSFDNDSTDETKAPQWKTIGNESFTSSSVNAAGRGYFGYCFFPNCTNGSAYSNNGSYNTFSINQETPTYYNVHYSETFHLSSGDVSVEVGGGNGCKELVIDNKVIAGEPNTYPSYCAYVCETDTTRQAGDQNVATMSKYLYDIKESDRDSSIRRNTLKKTTARVLDTVSVNNTSYKVVKIGDSAFSAAFCDSEKDGVLGAVGSFDDLKYVELPDSIESIGEYAFIRCYGVEKISAYTSGAAVASAYEMPAKLTFIGKNAFLFSGIKEVRKIPAACRFYENLNETTKITSVFANCLSLRKITFTTSSNRSTETTYTDYYVTTTYAHDQSTNYTSALYSTDNAGVAQNKNKLLVVLNRDSGDVAKASADHSSNAEGTVSGNGIEFNGKFKAGAFLFGAYKMGMWIKELVYGTAPSDDDGGQALFSPYGTRSGKTLVAKYIYLYTNPTKYEDQQCDLDTIDGNVLHMPQYALKGCENLATVKLPNETNGTIPNGLFSEATAVDFVTNSPEGSTSGVMDLTNTGYESIGKEAIKANTTITKFIAPVVSSFTIGEAAFQSCRNLATLDLSNVTDTLTLSAKAFAGTAVDGLNITWPASPCLIKIEGASTFADCTSMTSISLPTNMTTTLGKETFKGCTSLATVTVNGAASPITNIGESTFANCSSLSSFEFAKFTNMTTISASAFAGAGSLSSTGVNLPSSVTTVGNSAFSGSAITSITFNSSAISSIGNFAFQGCTSLTSVVFANSACTWGNNGYGQGMFNGCTSLVELQLPNGFDINNTKYSGNGTDEKNYFIYGSSNVKLFTHRKLTASTSISNNGWRKYNSTGSEASLYFFLSSDAITDLTNANVIDGNGVVNTTTNFWTTDANGHAIVLGTVTSYTSGVVTFSTGYTFDTTNGFVQH